MFVDVEHRHTLLALDLDWNDLALESTFLRRSCGAAMALYRKLVLVCARDAPFRRHIFSGDAHMNDIERIVQRTDHHVDCLEIAHTLPPASRWENERPPRHVLGSAANRDIRIAEHDGLGSGDDCLQPAAAQPI